MQALYSRSMNRIRYEIEVQSGVDLTHLNTFGVPSTAAAYTAIQSPRQLEMVARSFAAEEVLILGGGSNMLFLHSPQRWVLHNQLVGRGIMSSRNGFSIVAAAGGEDWHEFVKWTLAMGLGGLENLSLIPGTVGAAPIQNIGAYGVELQDVFHSLKAMDLQEGIWKTFTKEDCQFGYRNSLFKEEYPGRYFIAEVQFKLTNRNHVLKMDYGAIPDQLSNMGVSEPQPQAISEAVIAIRQRKLPDPSTIGNAGSFFKNPIIPLIHFKKLRERFPEMVHYPAGDGLVKVPAGWLIDACGWKGKSEGAVGSYKHQALVLINQGNATGNAVWAFAKKIKQSVRQRFDIELEPEVNLIAY